MGQIKTVYPTSYKLRQEKNIPSFGMKKSDYQLTLEPVLEEGLYGSGGELGMCLVQAGMCGSPGMLSAVLYLTHKGLKKTLWGQAGGR